MSEQLPRLSAGSITDQVCELVENPPKKEWKIAIGISAGLVSVLFVMIGILIWNGIGVWGNNRTVGWGFDIVNFVFWMGVAHAGTLISAIFYLFRQPWRTAITRTAEALTVFSIVCAGIYPVIHVGRCWVVHYFLPIPNQMNMWPNFRSPLLWDFFAINAYVLLSVLFWYMGLIPDFATLRDRARTRKHQIVYGILAMGWRGSARHWVNYERGLLLFSAIATPLIFCVSGILGYDFAMSQLPGWHSTILPVYFVAGALFSGFSLLTALLVIVRHAYKVKNIITDHHIDILAKLTLLLSLLMGYVYLFEAFTALYSQHPLEIFVLVNRAVGPYAPIFWLMVLGNVLVPQLLWFQQVRHSGVALIAIGIVANVGMWCERFVIIVVSLHRDFIPANWSMFIPTAIDIWTFIGSMGLFATLFLLFLRFMPIISIVDVKATVARSDHD